MQDNSLKDSVIPISNLLSAPEELLHTYTLDASPIILLWPYSSSSHHLSLVLGEPPFHVQRIHVTFNGPAADALAGAGASVGDTLVLSLDGAQWEVCGAGRALRFNDRLACEVSLFVSISNAST